ncbi:unknown protein [Seminavis robusta]|uniref:SCP domain-containing protein n=1 Tax=Seminavis robusta TaxID=568900 RepID=A0A9N8DML0_9STRA|nr:unknown protein [Seminavis robusta]|eukprot:Sro139_g064940.1 n/a (526) ;mRNA; f:7131-8708
MMKMTEVFLNLQVLSFSQSDGDDDASIPDIEPGIDIPDDETIPDNDDIEPGMDIPDDETEPGNTVRPRPYPQDDDDIQEPPASKPKPNPDGEEDDDPLQWLEEETDEEDDIDEDDGILDDPLPVEPVSPEPEPSLDPVQPDPLQPEPLPPASPDPPTPNERLKDLINKYREGPGDYIWTNNIVCVRKGPDGKEYEVRPSGVFQSLPPLNSSGKLDNAAQHLADHNNAHGVTSHEDGQYQNDADCDMGDPTTWRKCNAHIKRAQAFGYNSTYVVENATGILPDEGPEDALNRWICSDFHNQNLLNPETTEIGIGWTDDQIVFVGGKCSEVCTLNRSGGTSCFCRAGAPERQDNNEDSERTLLNLVDSFRKDNLLLMFQRENEELKAAATHLAAHNYLNSTLSQEDQDYNGPDAHKERVKDYKYNWPSGSSDVMQLIGQVRSDLSGNDVINVFETWITNPEVRDRLLYPLLDDIGIAWIGDMVVLIAANDPSISNDDLISEMQHEYESDPIGFCSRYNCLQYTGVCV